MDVDGGGWVYYVNDMDDVRSEILFPSDPEDINNMRISKSRRDFKTLLDFILSGDSNEDALLHYDLNYDGEITVSDLTRWLLILDYLPASRDTETGRIIKHRLAVD